MSRGTRAGGHAQGRVRPHRGRHAAKLGGQRPALRRLGDLPPQRLAGRPATGSTPRRPAAGSARSSSAPTTAARPGSRSATTSPTPATRRRRTSGTTAPPQPVGVQAGLAPRAVAAPTPTPSTPVPRTPRCSARTDGGHELAGAHRAARPRHRPAVAARRRRHVPAHDHARPGRPGAHLRRHLRGRARSAPTTAARLAADQPGPAVRRTSPTPTPRSATACTSSPCTRPGRTCSSCRSTGTSCAATTPASSGARSAATCPPTSVSRSRCTRTSRRPSTSCRSRATPSTTRRTGSCGSTAAARGGNEWEPLTEGLPQQDCYVNVLRDAMAVDSLDDCGRLLRHDRRPGLRVGRLRRHVGADRPRPAALCCRSKSRRCRDPGRAAGAPADAGRGVDGEVAARRAGAGHAAVGARRARGALPAAARHDPRPGHRRPARRSSASSPARRTCRTTPDAPLPPAVVAGAEPFLVVGAMAGG